MSKLKSAARLSLALVCAGMLSLAGCGAGEASADRNAADILQQADQQRDQAQSIDDLTPVQKSYDDLAANSGLSKQMQIVIRGRQAQLRQERISMMVADLRSQELVVGRDIQDIRQLAMQAGSAEASVDALKSYDPGNQVEKLKAQAAQIEGSADQLTWTMPNPTAADPNGSVSLPTLFGAKQEIETLTAQIQKNQADTDAAHKLSAAKGDEAEIYLRRAEGETGDQQVNDATAASVDRRDAALADAKAATLSNDLDRMKANRDRAADQATALEASIKLVNDQIQSDQARWSAITDQIQAQQKVEQKLIGDASGSSGIDALAKDLAGRLQDAAGLREKINNELNTVIAQLNATVAQCQQLRNEWLTDEREKMDDPDVVIWKQAQETLHPMTFGLQVANALETRATVAAEKLRIDQLIYHLMSGDQVSAADAAAHFKNLDVTALKGNVIKVPGLNDLLDSKKTGMARPKALDDLPQIGPDDLVQSKDDVNKAFQETVDAFDPQKYGATDSGPAADQRRNVALMDGAEANRKWAQFASMMGDTANAQTHTQAATDLEGQIDPAFALTASASAEGTSAATAAPAPAQPAQSRADHREYFSIQFDPIFPFFSPMSVDLPDGMWFSDL